MSSCFSARDHVGEMVDALASLPPCSKALATADAIFVELPFFPPFGPRTCLQTSARSLAWNARGAFRASHRGASKDLDRTVSAAVSRSAWGFRFFATITRWSSSCFSARKGSKNSSSTRNVFHRRRS